MRCSTPSTPAPPTRREFLGTLAGSGLAAVATGGQIAAQPTAHRIDIHHHFVSPSFLQTLTERNTKTPVPGLAAWKGYAPARAVETLDRVGIQTAMLSITAPGVWFGDAAQAGRLAREMNEYAAARLVGDYKGRFGLFAVLPLPDVPGTLREIEYAFDTLKADGVGILTSYGPAYLGDQSFAPVLAELNRRRAIVYTHPTDAQCCMNLVPGVANQMLEYPTDTTRTIVSLIASEAAAKHPDIRFIFSHAGGTITAVAGRVLGQGAPPDAFTRAPEPNSRLSHLRRFYYDTAGSANPVAMAALRALVPLSQILFGTDAPFVDGAPQVKGLQASGFNASELADVERTNALRLLGRAK
jgi:predicted TIM-barrel fold metal-dependent hydrolase